MTKSNAERQRQFRERKRVAGEEKKPRINTYIDQNAKAALERIAALYGLSQREAMERLFHYAEQVIISRDLSPKEVDAYHQEELRRDVISNEMFQPVEGDSA
ncbi:hypothetical protein ACET94_16590 [Aeromonas veronii]